MNSTQESTRQQLHAMRQFVEAQNHLLEAVNVKPNVPHQEIIALRTAVVSAQSQCIELGLEVETLYEASGRLMREAEDTVEGYAEVQGKIKPVLPRKVRIVVAGAMACALALLNHDLPPIFNLLGSMASYIMLNHWLGVLFPTPGIRIARKAVECGLTNHCFWPLGTDDHADYRWTCFVARLHGKGPKWIRSR